MDSCFRRNDRSRRRNDGVRYRNGFLSFPHLLEACYEPAQGIGHEAARQADVDQLEAGFIREGAVQGGMQFLFGRDRLAAAAYDVCQGGIIQFVQVVECGFRV